MIWLLSIPALILILSFYILFAPFYLEVNSTTGLCRVRFHKLASARIYITESSLLIDLKIMWWHKIIDLFAPGERKMKPEKKKTEKAERKISLRKVRAVIKSFKVNKFYLTIDTGSMETNGILYPLFLWMGMRMKKNVTINFVNENELVLEIENNAVRMLRAYIIS
jgi:hypothetical protein